MTINAIQPDELSVPSTPASWVVPDADLVFIAGQMPVDGNGRVIEGDFRAQASKVFENLGYCLHAAGCTFGDVLKVNTYLSDLTDFDDYNTIYKEWFNPPYPARTTVQAGLLGFLIEVDAIARRHPSP